MCIRDRVKHVRLPVRELEALQPLGMLPEQIAKVRRGLVRGRDAEQHGVPVLPGPIRAGGKTRQRSADRPWRERLLTLRTPPRQARRARRTLLGTSLVRWE